MTVVIKPAAQEGRFDAVVNGSITNAGTLPADENIRPGLNLRANPDSPEFKQFNSAERSLPWHGQFSGNSTSTFVRNNRHVIVTTIRRKAG